MHVIVGLGLTGPYKSEQAFKRDWISKTQERCYPGAQYFQIETEETEPGFPDVMVLNFRNNASFYEFKITDTHRNFEMRKTQPRFYITHPSMNTSVLVWDVVTHKAYSFTQEEIKEACLASESLKLNVGDITDE